jgi:hypothetical protein
MITAVSPPAMGLHLLRPDLVPLYRGGSGGAMTEDAAVERENAQKTCDTGIARVFRAPQIAYPL